MCLLRSPAVIAVLTVHSLRCSLCTGSPIVFAHTQLRASRICTPTQRPRDLSSADGGTLPTSLMGCPSRLPVSPRALPTGRSCPWDSSCSVVPLGCSVRTCHVSSVIGLAGCDASRHQTGAFCVGAVPPNTAARKCHQIEPLNPSYQDSVREQVQCCYSVVAHCTLLADMDCAFQMALSTEH